MSRTPDSGMADDSLDVRLAAPAEVRVGRPVTFGMSITNRTSRPLDLRLTGRPPAFDFIVSTPDGRRVWNRLDGAVVAAVLEVRRLAPGETLEFTAEWNQRSNQGAVLEPGSYQLQGMLLTDQPAGLRTPTRTLRIVF